MKRLLTLLTATLLVTACSRQEDVFYSTTYAVTEVKARHTLPDTSDSELTQLVEQLIEEVVATAPVTAGGAYRLDFSRFDGGELYVTPRADAEVVTGEFDKVPASSKLTFRYSDEEYPAKVTSYTTEEGMRHVCFEVDVTDRYAERLPEGSSVRLIRQEYTSHLYD